MAHGYLSFSRDTHFFPPRVFILKRHLCLSVMCCYKLGGEHADQSAVQQHQHYCGERAAAGPVDRSERRRRCRRQGRQQLAVQRDHPLVSGNSYYYYCHLSKKKKEEEEEEAGQGRPAYWFAMSRLLSLDTSCDIKEGAVRNLPSQRFIGSLVRWF